MAITLTPNPINSDVEYARFHHLDLENLEDTELRDELYALRPLLWGLSPDNWLRDRVKTLERELAKRRGKNGNR